MNNDQSLHEKDDMVHEWFMFIRNFSLERNVDFWAQKVLGE